MPYSTTQVHGIQGSCVVGATTLAITEWSAEDKVELANGTTSANLGANSWVAGRTSVNGTFKCIWDTAQNPYLISILPGTNVTLVLHITAATYYSMTAILESVKPTMPTGDLVTWEVSFNSQGTVTKPAA